MTTPVYLCDRQEAVKDFLPVRLYLLRLDGGAEGVIIMDGDVDDLIAWKTEKRYRIRVEEVT